MAKWNLISFVISVHICELDRYAGLLLWTSDVGQFMQPLHCLSWLSCNQYTAIHGVVFFGGVFCLFFLRRFNKTQFYSTPCMRLWLQRFVEYFKEFDY